MAAATGDDVIVEFKEPAGESSTNIAMLPISSEEKKAEAVKPVAAVKSFVGQTLDRFNPFGPKDPEVEKAKAEAKAKAAEEKEKEAEEKKRKEEEESDDPGEIPEDQKGKMAWLRRVMRKWLPPPWNYLLAGSPGTAGVAFGGYWLWTKYIMADDKKAE